MENKCALVDADFLIYLVCHNKKDSEHIKSLDECKQQVDECISSIMLSTKATHYICFLTIGKNFRYSIFKDYKANRKKLEKPLYFKEIRDYLISDYKAISHPDLESDDMCLITRNNVSNSFIVSNDKDLLMLEGIHYNPNKELWVETSEQQAEYYFWTSVITGDNSDGIKGIPGRGIKYAQKFLGEDTIEYAAKVLMGYVVEMGDELGIQEFYKNYMCLKIKDKWEGFVVPEPIEWKITTIIDAEFKE